MANSGTATSGIANSGVLTLFGEPPRASLYPSAFAVSMLLHAGFFSLLTLRLIQSHTVLDRFPASRFAVRYVDFHSVEPQTRQEAGGGVHYSGQSRPTRADAQPSQRRPASAASGGSAPGSPAVTRLTPKRMPAPETLIQPEIAHMLEMPQKTAVPLVVLWTAEKPVVKRVLPPLPQQASISVSQPSLDAPIKEENIADLRLSSTAFVTQGPAAQPSTTSPVIVHGPEEAKRVPQTASKQPEPPTPGRVISLSDMRVAEGKVAIPMANQTASATPGRLIPGQLKDLAPAGNGSSTTQVSGSGAGKGSGDRTGSQQDASAKPSNAPVHPGSGDQATKTAKGDPGPGSAGKPAIVPTAHPGTPAPAKAEPPPNVLAAVSSQPAAHIGSAAAAAAGANAGNGAGNQAANPPGSVHISLPKDGQFGVVVFGTSIADKYPETAEMWSGRLASTVYLHVGLAKSWILQYALPRLADAAGNGHIEAPWPYEIVRPNLDPGDADADAIILHGFVNKDGRFDRLEIVFPAQLTQAPTVLAVLNQWQFRAAKQNGQPAPVEILLIIPDQSE